MFDASPRPELLAFLSAVKADPDDDTAKLVLADWLQEQDDEADRARGEYVRALVEYDRLTKQDQIPQTVEALKRLHRENQTAWFGQLIAAGFRHCDTFSSSRWSLPFPSVDGVNLSTRQARALAKTEQYAWVVDLALNRMNDADFTKLAKSPLLESLIGLTINQCYASESAIAAVLNSRRIRAMKRLQFAQVTASESLASSPHLSQLRELMFWLAGLGDARFKGLCDSPHLNQLRSLRVTADSVTIHAARAFTEATGLTSLTELDFWGNHIGPDGVLILVASPSSGRLRKLGLCATGLADYGVEAICRQPHMCNLTHLDLSRNKLSNRAAVALAKAEHLRTLEVLNLSKNEISGQGAMALAHSPHFTNLRRLYLDQNPIRDKARAALRARFGDCAVW